MATVAQIRERLHVLCAAIPGIEEAILAYDDPAYPLGQHRLPLILVFRPGRATHTRDSYGSTLTTRRWLIWAIIAELGDSPTPEQKQAAEELCDPFLDSIPQFFHRYPELQLEGTDEGIALSVSINDDGTREYQRAGKRYAGIPYPLDITTTTQIWSELT